MFAGTFVEAEIKGKAVIAAWALAGNRYPPPSPLNRLPPSGRLNISPFVVVVGASR